MAILTINSDLLAGVYFTQTPRIGGVLRCDIFTVPVPVEADIGSTVRLATLPQHAVLLPHLSWIRCTAIALLTVSLGWEEYDPLDASVVVADPDGLGTTLTIAAGTPVLFSSFPAAPLPRTFEGPAVITALTAGAAITAAAVVSGCIVYAAHF